ncbi:MAG: thioredoxin [Gammaproteobacteria bacterium]|nr:MAG: thioredoxin [Gammaproteobacteria bacterium]
MSGDLESRWIFEATTDNFATLVLENSARGPVLVNFWSPSAGPCLRLYPLLDKLVREFGGRLLLVNLKTDDHGELSRRYGVTSLPTLKMFVNGRIVETVHGYQPEADLRRTLEKHLPRDSDRSLAAALQVHASGDGERGIALLAEAAMEDPGNARIPLALAKLLVRAGRHQEAHRVLHTLPREMRGQDEIKNLLVHLGFVLCAASAAEQEVLEAAVRCDGGDLESRYQLASVLLMSDAYEAAMEQLLEIMRRDRKFRDDAGREGLIAIFRILGNQGPLVERFRVSMLEGTP